MHLYLLLYNDFVPRQRHEQCSLGGLIQTCFIILSMGISYFDVCVTILSSVECFGISKKVILQYINTFVKILRYLIKVICMKCYYWKFQFVYKSISQLQIERYIVMKNLYDRNCMILLKLLYHKILFKSLIFIALVL